MKKPVSFSIDAENLSRLERDKLSTQLGRSGIVRVALTEYYERKEMSEKAKKNENTKE